MVQEQCEMQARVFDDELDLSFESLKEVPMENMLCLPKIAIIDLSNNDLDRLPDDFPRYLQHLVHLDVSNNFIKTLPKDFGMLIKLQHLDISFNQIHSLDVSFSKLRNLEWLNVKENPLVPILKEVAKNPWGIDENYYSCAKNIVAFMQQVENFGNSDVFKSLRLVDLILGLNSFGLEITTDTETKVEVLFKREKDPILLNNAAKSKNGNLQEGVIIEDHNGKFFYVTFGRKAPAKNLESVSRSSEEKILPLNVAQISTPSSIMSITWSWAKKFARTSLIFMTLWIFLTFFLSLSLHPKDLQSFLKKIPSEFMLSRLGLHLTEWHSWMSHKLEQFYFFPVAPTQPPTFWQWLLQSISSIFHSLYQNFGSTKT